MWLIQWKRQIMPYKVLAETKKKKKINSHRWTLISKIASWNIGYLLQWHSSKTLPINKKNTARPSFKSQRGMFSLCSHLAFIFFSFFLSFFFAVDNPGLFSHVPVTVQVLDMNDNPPEIGTEEEVIVCESSRPGQVSAWETRLPISWSQSVDICPLSSLLTAL